MQMDEKEINWQNPIWDREKPGRFWDPSKKLIQTIRDYQRIKSKGGAFSQLKLKVCVFRYRFWSTVTGAEIDLMCEIGGGLLMPHPNGIVIHPKSTIGENCLIFQQVTLAGEVQMGFHVDVGAGAKILGPVRIGNNVRIGANAVVTSAVGDGQTVVGVPAKEVSGIKI